jgi:hypothetical protein
MLKSPWQKLHWKLPPSLPGAIWLRSSKNIHCSGNFLSPSRFRFSLNQKKRKFNLPVKKQFRHARVKWQHLRFLQPSGQIYGVIMRRQLVSHTCFGRRYWLLQSLRVLYCLTYVHSVPKHKRTACDNLVTNPFLSSKIVIVGFTVVSTIF